MTNIKSIIQSYLEVVSEARSPRTYTTYKQALETFYDMVGDSELSTSTFINFLRAANRTSWSPATKAIQRSAIMGLYQFYGESHPTEVNLVALIGASRRYARKEGIRFPTFDRDALEKVIAYCLTLHDGLIDYRDRAFVLLLADTGLRISEACALRRGDIDWNEARTVIVGKGDKQAVVRISARALDALRDYLRERGKLDGGTGKTLSSLPLFARHDPAAGKKRVLPVAAGGMWHAVKERVEQAGLERSAIRVHDFRHYFVTAVLLSTGNLKAAQTLARHANITQTSRYAHLADNEADKIYDDTFNG